MRIAGAHSAPWLVVERFATMARDAIGSAMQRLSTGLRVNRAMDDAAGLAISERMKSGYLGAETALRNIQDGISLVQTAEGGLSEVHAVLQRLRTLAVAAANGTAGAEQRTAMQLEANALLDATDSIASGTIFNQRTLLDGSWVTASVQAGDRLDDRVAVSLARMDSVGLGLRTAGSTLDISASVAPTAPEPTAPTTDPAPVDPAPVDPATTTPATVPFNGNPNSNAGGNGKGKGSGNSGGGSTAPAAPAPTPTPAPAPTPTPTPAPASTPASTATPAAGGFSLLSREDAVAAIGIVDDAIWLVSRQRADIGAVENVLHWRAQGAERRAAELRGAQARIVDADFALESMRLVRGRILLDAATSLVAQAPSERVVVDRLLAGLPRG